MSAPGRLTISKANDQTLKIVGLQNADTLDYFNASTVTATLYDSAGSAVTGLTSVSFSYVSGSNGNYTGSVSESFDPSIGTDYTLKIDASEGSTVGHWEIPVSVRVRRQ